MKWKEENNCLPEEILQQFIDEELKQEEAVLVEKHLSTCENCQSAIKEKRLLIKQLNKALNFVDEDKMVIPEFDMNKTKVVEFKAKRRYYWWSAAAVILLVVSIFLSRNFNEPEVNLEYVLQDMNYEIDANKPWYEQTSTIYVLNESGEIIDKIENL